jgi:hypothetical protein
MLELICKCRNNGLQDTDSLGDLINGFRWDTLDLEKVPAMFDSNLVQTGKVPFTYCWSPALIPKPLDWPATIGSYLHFTVCAQGLIISIQMFAVSFFEPHRHTNHPQRLMSFSEQAQNQFTSALEVL